MTITLETDRLILRRPNVNDVDIEAEFYASDRSYFVGGPMTKEMVWRSLAAIIGHWEMRGYGYFALDLKSTGEYVGRVGAWNPEGWPEPEIGWSMMEGHEGHGYAYEAALRVREWVYADLGWETAISMIAHGNDRSIALARSA